MITFVPDTVMSSSDMNSNFQDLVDLCTNITPDQLSLEGQLSFAPATSSTVSTTLTGTQKGMSITRTGAISQPLLKVQTTGANAFAITATNVFDFAAELAISANFIQTALKGSAEAIVLSSARPFPSTESTNLSSIPAASVGALTYNPTTHTIWAWNGTAHVDTLPVSSLFERVSGALRFKKEDSPTVHIPSVGYKFGGTFSTLSTTSTAEQTVATLSFTLPEERLAIIFGQGGEMAYQASVDAEIEIAARLYVGSTKVFEALYSRGFATFGNIVTVPIQAFVYVGVLAAGSHTVTARVQRLSTTSVALQNAGSGAELRAIFL